MISLRSFIRADGPHETFDMLHVGRKNPELIARLSELSALLVKLGCSMSPYEKAFVGYEVEKDNTILPELEPYRDLDPSRLKLSGSGAWDVTNFLPDDLVIVYREPESIRVDREPATWEYPHIRDAPETVAALAKLWDSQGLLFLHQDRVQHRQIFELVRIFNCYKSVDKDRQIGDRRGRNAVECKVQGPSSNLPAGPDLCDLFLDLRKKRISVSVSDRRDFYHQIWVTRSRAITNTLGPGLPQEWLKQTSAFGSFLLRSAKARYQRREHGDHLLSSWSNRVDKHGLIWASFKSVLQGDHAGVEIATAAHSQLLKNVGLLSEDSSMVASRPWRDDSLAEGLVIDDYFAVSVDDKHLPDADTRSAQAYRTAQKAYGAVPLLGSPEKDVFAAKEGKVIGAFINGSDRATALGVCTVAAPAAKRLALSALTLELCSLPYTTVSLHRRILGAWVSVLLFRRPMMSLLNESFRLASLHDDKPDAALIPFPREVVCELVLVSVLMPLAVTDISVPFDDKLFASDASENRGAICSVEADPEVTKILSRACKTKGAYTRLQSPWARFMQKLGLSDESVEEEAFIGVDRPLAFAFEFIEIFAGSSRVTLALERLGVICGPPIDLSRSEEYNMKEVFVLEWLFHLIERGSLRAFLLEPPCTTFSIMRRPALRDRICPFGFDPSDPQTHDGNVLAGRSLQLLQKARVHRVSGILERPFSAKTKYLPAYQSLLRKPGVTEVRSDSCQFGSQHQKSFAFLGVNIDLSQLARRCKGKCDHIPIAGVYTKASAVYTWELSMALAWTLRRAIREVKKSDPLAGDIVPDGLENQLVNEIVSGSTWIVENSWRFKRPQHINILEMKSVERLVIKQAKRGQRRFVCFVDSNVSRGALGKGRSASFALTAVLQRIASCLVAFGLYMTTPFCPTRLNVADDPTRLHELREPLPGLRWKDLSFGELWDLARLPKARRWASNWIRLLLLLRGASIYRRAYGASRITRTSEPVLFGQDHHCPACPAFDFASMDFDQTLGFPGEGPPSLSLPSALAQLSASVSLWRSLLFGLFWLLLPLLCLGSLISFLLFALRHPSCGRARGAVVFILCTAIPVRAMEPHTAGERTRAQARALRPALPSGRPTLEATTRLRARYWKIFESWLLAEGVDIAPLLETPTFYVEEWNAILTRFGRLLYEAGKPYNQYAETINYLTSLRPTIRRHMQGSWDLAYSWMASEPTCHHVAMPWQVLLAMVTTCLLWGWVPLAGALSLCWGALLRAGEFLSATRSNLLLPCDVQETIAYAMVAIVEPKTRNSGARHQAAKLEIPDLLLVVNLAFGRLPETAKLWSWSGQTLRQRFRDVLAALLLPLERRGELKPLDLGSLRAGGATWHLATTENSEYTRRKGRWLSSRVMEIYVQETTALLFLKRVPAPARERVLSLAALFPQVLQQSLKFSRLSLPFSFWRHLFGHEAWTDRTERS